MPTAPNTNEAAPPPGRGRYCVTVAVWLVAENKADAEQQIRVALVRGARGDDPDARWRVTGVQTDFLYPLEEATP